MFLFVPNYEDEYLIDPETGEVWSNHSKRLIKSFLDTNGYLILRLCKNGKVRHCGVHRLVYMAVYPEDDIDGYEIDHINNNPLNNHWENLRKATSSENCCNTKVQKNNKLGQKNINITQYGAYRVEIMKNRKKVFRKTYKTLEEAIQNRDIQLQIHHQEFANYT